MFFCTRKKKYEKCISEAKGVVTKVHYNEDTSRRLTVEYVVDGEKYTLKENITHKITAIKIGNIPIGQKKEEYVTAVLGDSVGVMYNPDKPEMSYIKNNTGKYI